MKKKTFNLVVGITDGVITIASAVGAYVYPAYAVQIVTAMGIITTAVSEVCSIFIKEEK